MKKFSLMLVVATLCCGVAAAQLGGTYTVDATLPTGSGNYATLAAAAADLGTLGISSPVIFNVIPNAASYAGFSLPAAIVGSSSTNTVTFQGVPGVSVAGVAAGFPQVIRLGPAAVSTTTFAGPSYVIIDGLDIVVPSAGAGVIVTGSTGCTVRNCFIHGSNSGAGIAIINSQNCLVENNEVANTAATPGLPGTAIYSGAISVYYQGAGNVVTRNRVHDCAGQGIFVGSQVTTTAPSDVTITNNFVWACTGGTGTTYPGGVVLRGLAGASIVANNSIWMTGGNLAGIHQTGAAYPQPVTIANNVVKHDGIGGACFKFEASTVVPSATFDHNLYDPGPSAFVGAVGATNYATLAAWQALAGPSLAGKEINTVVANPGFVGATDLHITPTSPAFNTGLTVLGVAVDLDGQGRPMNGFYDRGADETFGVGLFAGFSASPLSGPAPLGVSFLDQSYSSAPGGIFSWAWDFTNDGIDDSFAQSPSFTYLCPGSYSVKLTVNDGLNPPSVTVKPALITVAPQLFVMGTSGGGVGDLFINPVSTLCYPTTVQGWTLISFSPLNPLGGGPFGGLYPDSTTINFINYPASPGVPQHFVPAPGLYPDTTFSAPAGALTFLAGLTLDANEILVGPGFTILRITNVVRMTF